MFKSQKINVVLLSLVAVLVFMNIHQCSNEPKDKVVIKYVDRTIEIPAKEGKFDTIVKPVPVYIKDTVYTKNEINQELLSKYDSLKDSLKREAYKQAIKKNTYKQKFENDTVAINVYAETTGTLDKLTTDYKIKPFNFTYREKETTIYKKPKLSLYVGAGFQSAIQGVDNASLSVSVGIMSVKGLHIEGSYNTNNQIGISIKKNLFTKY